MRVTSGAAPRVIFCRLPTLTGSTVRIHQISHLFSPDELAGASLYTDLSRFLRDEGHDVRVTTTFSYYPRLRYSDDCSRMVCNEEFEHISVRRIKMWLPRRHSSWRRLVPELTYMGGLTAWGRFRGWTPDVVVAACPMLAQVAVARWLYAGKGIPRLVVLQDSMAHAATELGIIQNRLLGQVLHRFERWCLRGATRICTISEPMRVRVDSITARTVPCEVVPNWIHKSAANTIAARRELMVIRKLGHLFYSGNFGVKQGLPAFLQEFRDVRGEWTLGLHGDGVEAENLRRASLGWGPWISIGPLLTECDYADRLLAATACVVTQMPGVGANFLPSKLLPALAAGTPVLAVCEANSPLGREVSDGQFGVVVPPRDRTSLGMTLERWRQNPAELEHFSRNALARAKRYSREDICGRYERILLELVEDAKRKRQNG